LRRSMATGKPWVDGLWHPPLGPRRGHLRWAVRMAPDLGEFTHARLLWLSGERRTFQSSEGGLRALACTESRAVRGWRGNDRRRIAGRVGG
jgi:hypothetical protein